MPDVNFEVLPDEPGDIEEPEIYWVLRMTSTARARYFRALQRSEDPEDQDRLRHLRNVLAPSRLDDAE